MIHCDHCKAVNPPEQVRCKQCNGDLLPGMKVWVRLLILVLSLAIAAFAGWVAYRIVMADTELPDLGCVFTSPIWWGALAIFMPIFGLTSMFKRTPQYERYLERGKRHLTLDKEQALADLNRAVELAPEKKRAPILKERAKLLESMGAKQDAIRDRIASMESKGAYDGSATFAGMLGADEDKFVDGQMKAEREVLMKESHAVALGWCPRCKAAVGLDEKSKCKVHKKARIKFIHLGLPRDVEQVKAKVLAEREKERKEKIRQAIVNILALIAAAFGLWYLFTVVMR